MSTMPVMTTRETPLTTEDTLLTVLERARAVGFLGPGPFRAHRDHAAVYTANVPSEAERFIDLGSGGGVPGLPLLVDRPDMTGVLLDAAQKRCSFLVWAATELGISDRVTVIQGRAEEKAHDADLRAAFDVVVCRGFGPPAITVECSLGYLKPGGRLLISEPPDLRPWPKDVLSGIGLAQRPPSSEAGPREDDVAGIAVFERVGDLDPSLPRPARQQKRTPLFRFE